jgi:hypothetical protein
MKAASPSTSADRSTESGIGTRLTWFFGSVAFLFSGAVLFLLGKPTAPETSPVSPAPPTASSSLSLAEAIQIDGRGDGQFRKVFQFPADQYADLQKQNPDPALLQPKFHAPSGQTLDNFQARYDDDARTLSVSWTSRGMAAPRRSPLWEALLPEAAGLVLASLANNEAVLTGTAQSEFGPAAVEMHVLVPPGSRDVQILSAPARIVYLLPLVPVPSSVPVPQVALRGTHPFLQFNLEVKPLMWCLLPVYGKPPLAGRWLARARTKNSGDQTLQDIRVRFRIPDCDPNWKEFTCRTLAPGQTALCPFSPTLDVPKLASLNGLRDVPVEVEYQYQQADGRVIARKGQKQSAAVLPSTQLMVSTTSLGHFENDKSPLEWPLALAALANPDDSAIQELAGRIKARAGTSSPGAGAAEAQRFLNELYTFMRAHLQCQNPLGRTGSLASPLYNQEGMPIRPVQSGRDLLLHKRGSTLDLALLFCSVSEAAGLEPVLVCSLDYCLPAVKLPGGSLRPVEVGLIPKASFEEACRTAGEEYQTARKDSQLVQVDLKKLHQAGVASPQQKPISLRELNVPDQDGPAVASPRLPPPQPARWPVAPRETPPPLAGKWYYSGRAPDRGTLTCTLVLAKDNTFQSKLRKSANGAGGPPRAEELENSGAYKAAARTITLTNRAGEEVHYEYMLDRDTLYLTSLAGGGRFQMRFVRLPD